MAIALDAETTSGQTTGTSLSFSHSTAGSNRILWVGVVSYGSTNRITGVTYAGNSMTRVYSGLNAGGSWIELYYIVAPSTGANNVVVTQSSSGNTLQAVAVSYTGASQTGIPDSSNSVSADTGDPVTVTTTTVADNTWLVGVCYTNRNNSAGTGTVLRGGLTSQFSMMDSNGARTPAGSQSLQVDLSSAGNTNMYVASFAPHVEVTFAPKCVMF